MASPSVVLETPSNSSSGSTSLSINTGSPLENEGVIIFLSRDPGEGTVTWADGYIKLFDVIDDDLKSTGSVAYKQAGASEVSSTTVTATVSSKFAARAYRISGHLSFATQAPDFGYVTDDGLVTVHNPPSVNVTGGPKDILSIAALPFDTVGATVSTFPSGYTSTGLTASGASGSQCSLAFCRRDLSAVSSEDPGAFTITATRRGIPITVLAQEDAASGSAITADIDEAGDTTAAPMAVIISITASTAEEGDTTTAAISTVVDAAEITANVNEAGDTTTATLATIVSINANVNEDGDTTTAAISTSVAPAEITANVNEAGDTTSAPMAVIVSINANVNELGDTTAAAISTGIAPAQITANIDELGDTTSAPMATIISINANVNELGDTTAAEISTGGELIAANAEINIFPAYSGRSAISPAYASKVDIS